MTPEASVATVLVTNVPWYHDWCGHHHHCTSDGDDGGGGGDEVAVGAGTVLVESFL